MCGGDLGPFYFSLFYYNSLVLSGEKLSQILVPFLDFFGSFLFSLPCFHSFSLPPSFITIWYHLPRWRSWSFSIIPSSKLAVRSPTTPNTNVSSCCPSSGYQLTIPFFFSLLAVLLLLRLLMLSRPSSPSVHHWFLVLFLRLSGYFHPHLRTKQTTIINEPDSCSSFPCFRSWTSGSASSFSVVSPAAVNVDMVTVRWGCHFSAARCPLSSNKPSSPLTTFPHLRFFLFAMGNSFR